MTTAALNSAKDYAYYYRDKLGFSVFVLKTEPAKKRKEPAVRSTDPYFERKPTDEEMDLWFKIDPNYNLALSMGQVSQAIAFDVDGPNAVKTIESKIPEMSSTLREAFANTMKNKTGSGSEHVVFKIEGQIDDINKEQLWTDGKPHSQILMLASKSYIVAAPSLHPNNKRYSWNGRDPQTITRQELNEFIRLISPPRASKPQTGNNNNLQTPPPTTARTLSPEQMQELLSWIKPYYSQGNRDHIIFYLSGMMRKANFTLETAGRFITLSCNASAYSDEDLDKSLTVVDNTYEKPVDEVRGKSGLYNLLVTSFETNNEYDSEQYQQRIEAFSQICQIINGEQSAISGERRQQQPQQPQQQHVSLPSDPMLLIPYKNDYFEYLIDCAKKTVKEESALVRQIMYTLLSAYSHDPLNLGVLAPTSEGKTYPVIQCAKFGPIGTDIRIVGSMTPKVLIREKDVLVDKNMNPIAKDVKRIKVALAEAKHKKQFKAVEQHKEELGTLLEDAAYIIDFSNTVLLFLEPPRPELWDLIKPILSHDFPEMEHPYVETKQGGGLEVKRIITRGAPACIFCSAKDESRWEAWDEIESRFMITSPNMVKPKYQAGNKLIAQKKGLPKVIKDKRIISPRAIELGKQCFNYLKQQIQKNTSATDSPVWIPYTELLAEILPSDKGSDNRIANRLYSILSMVALARAHLRPKLIIGNEQLVIATLEDLQEALHVMQNVSGMPPHKLKFYQQYIVPLYLSDKSNPLTSRKICDFYNANTPKGTLPMNTDRLTKTYLQELINHSYLEQEQNEEKKSKEYLYTPLVDIEEEPPTEEQAGNNNNKNNNNKDDPSNRSKLGHFDENLQFSKLLLPENHMGIPENWLKQEILQLQSDRIEGSVFKIIDQNGDEVPIDDFIQGYENGSRGLKLQLFTKVPTRFDASKTVEITTSEQFQEEADEEISTEDKQQDKNSSKPSDFDHFDEEDDSSSQVSPIALEEEKHAQNDNCNRSQLPASSSTTTSHSTAIGSVIERAMKDSQGNNKGYFTLDDLVFTMQTLPNERWTENEIEQTLYALLEEGKIRETEPGEPGKYRPTSHTV